MRNVPSKLLKNIMYNMSLLILILCVDGNGSVCKNIGVIITKRIITTIKYAVVLSYTHVVVR